MRVEFDTTIDDVRAAMRTSSRLRVVLGLRRGPATSEALGLLGYYLLALGSALFAAGMACGAYATGEWGGYVVGAAIVFVWACFLVGGFGPAATRRAMERQADRASGHWAEVDEAGFRFGTRTSRESFDPIAVVRVERTPSHLIVVTRDGQRCSIPRRAFRNTEETDAFCRLLQLD